MLSVYRQYIASAPQADKYRTEPPFKLLGSYRNMFRMAEKVCVIMNRRELLWLISNRYLGKTGKLLKNFNIFNSLLT